MTVPAALPVTIRTSLLARKKPIITPERTGASVAPGFQIRNEAKIRLPTVSVIQNTSAVPHGSIAKRVVIVKALGRYICRVTIWRTFPVSGVGLLPLHDKGLGPHFSFYGSQC